MKKINKGSEIDFNKLIKDIINAAKEDPNVYPTSANYTDDRAKLITTLKLEVTVTNDSLTAYGENQKNSKRLVLLTINDA
jgi:hypothetical protein